MVILKGLRSHTVAGHIKASLDARFEAGVFIIEPVPAREGIVSLQISCANLPPSGQYNYFAQGVLAGLEIAGMRNVQPAEPQTEEIDLTDEMEGKHHA